MIKLHSTKWIGKKIKTFIMGFTYDDDTLNDDYDIFEDQETAKKRLVKEYNEEFKPTKAV